MFPPAGVHKALLKPSIASAGKDLSRQRPTPTPGRTRPPRALVPPHGGGGVRLACSHNTRRAALAGALILGATLAQARAADETASPCPPGDTPAGQTRLLVTVTGAKPVRGNITFTLYGSNPAAFLAHRGSIALSRTTLASTQAEACFALSAPGAYAVAVYHDANDNHHFDRTLIGLPAEGYGFSNNVVPLLLPSFASARITVPAGESRISIRLIY